jgi:anaerobic magnesium-protoporphyrin IX monomethyl ester cyclase
MRVLFTHSYFLRFDPKQWSLQQPYAPLGTMYAASMLRENGYNVNIHDVMFAEGAKDIQPVLDSFKPDVLVIYDDGFNYLTKMCLTNMREAAFEMSKMAKERGCKVIVSSSDSTDHYEMYMDAGADMVMLGEAEMTLLEIVNGLKEKNINYAQIQGLAYRENGNTIKTVRRNVMKDLDSLPMPAWDLVDITPYKKAWMRSSGYFSMNMGTTRGCPFKCNWCAKPIYGNRYNSRSPQNVVNELKFLKEKYGFDHIWFCDDIFGLKPGWVNEFADLVEKEQLHLKFKIQSRADLLLQEDNIKALARAGCDNVWIGAESGSQRILDAMDKGTTIAQIKESTRLLKEHGIKPSFFIQFGYLSETKEDIQKTIKMINELLPYSIGVSVSYPLPGTGFYEKVKADLVMKTNWTDSDELKLMFSNTYQPEYYKQLHRYVQNNYRMHKAIDEIKKAFSNPMNAIKKMAAMVYYIPTVFIAGQKLKALERA